MRERFVTGTGQVLAGVHASGSCSGPCPIHAPSDHHMKDWPLHWRDDRRIFERICEHGVGHPDPDDMDHRVMQMGESALYGDTHGCDGCCQGGRGGA